MGVVHKVSKNKYISPATYRKMLNEGHHILLLDVRTQGEFEESHIPNAFLFPVANIKKHIEKHFPDKDLTYILYCRSGIRSHMALKMMQQLGYIEVYDMGGIIDWPYEIINH